jgi:hypothetical protein
LGLASLRAAAGGSGYAVLIGANEEKTTASWCHHSPSNSIAKGCRGKTSHQIVDLPLILRLIVPHTNLSGQHLVEAKTDHHKI